MKERIFEGIAASPGFVVGKVYLFDLEDTAITPREIAVREVGLEIARFEDALIETRKELLKIRQDLADRAGRKVSDFFDAHLLVVEDRTLIAEVVKGIEEKKLNAEYIFQEVIKEYTRAFLQIKDDYIKERLSDIQDVARRVLHNLTGKKRADLALLDDEVVVIAHDLAPSDTALMHKENVIGFATDIGGRSSHTTIMARSLAIPAVVGLGDISAAVHNGDPIVVDGSTGRVIIFPSRTTLARINREKQNLARFESKLKELKHFPAETTDGFRVTLAANIEMPEDIPAVISHGGEGVGLYRTEYFYLNRLDIPDEEEQFQAYNQVASELKPASVIIRTLDLGGDKFNSALDIPREINPFMGWRAIRFCLERQDIFKVQLRAILRASCQKNVKVMFPMISGFTELERVLEIWEETKNDLKREGIPFYPDMEVGIMIEIPAAVAVADTLARMVDFFSIGTNDLIQYTLAVDRVNERIAYLYDPLNPAVLKFIHQVIDIGHKNNIWVGMCGEMAGDTLSVPILLGLGLDEFSVSPVMIPEVKKLITSLRLADARKLAHTVLRYRSADKIRQESKKLLANIDPTLLKWEDNKL